LASVGSWTAKKDGEMLSFGGTLAAIIDYVGCWGHGRMPYAWKGRLSTPLP
jgi:hypothetical protein